MQDRPNSLPLPPIFLVAMVALCYLLDTFLPIGWDPERVTPLMRWGGGLLIAIAIALDVWTFATLRRHRTTIRPDRGANALAKDGPFAFSRNPIYLGNVLIVSGLGFVLGSRWFIFGAVALYVLLLEFAIKREEEHLAKRFGADWRAYASRVRRWI